MKIAAAFAGLGLAVAAALLLALRFAVGSSVRDGVGRSVSGLPRRYADYLPTGGTGSSADLRAVAVVLGVGIGVGLLFGVVLRPVTARRTGGGGRPLAAAWAVFSALAVGTLLAVLLHFFGDRFAGGADFGWYSSSPLSRDGVFYGGGPTPSWWPLVVTGALVGLLVGAVAAGGAVWTGRARRA